MSEARGRNQFSGRIEGGIDAIVIGANADGLAAAAYLAKAGLKTVLLESGADVGGLVRTREFAPGRACVDGEHLIFALDQDVVDELDLYRHGLSFASRRLDTSYFFEDGRMLLFDGDLHRAAQALSTDENANAFETLAKDAIELSAFFRPAFKNPNAFVLGTAFAAAPPSLSRRISRLAYAPAIEVMEDYMGDGLLKTAFLSEACFRSSAAPDEAFGFLSLILRWAGETSGLQGAVGYPEGGVGAVTQALRRAVQASKAEIRAACPINSILIEWDRAAGVELEGGGQIRAPIVVAAQNARRVFMDLIGPAHIDIGFQREVTAPAPRVSTARLHLALKGVARDEKTRDIMRRRMVFAPRAAALRRAFAAARAGEAPDALIIEAVFTTVLDEAGGEEKAQTLSVMAHPLPADDSPDEARRREIEKAVIRNLEQFAPDIGARVEAAELRLVADFAGSADSGAVAAKPGVMQQWARAAAIKAAGHIGGLYFCGPEAQIGVGLNCSAGRAAASAAIRAARRGEVGA